MGATPQCRHPEKTQVCCLGSVDSLVRSRGCHAGDLTGAPSSMAHSWSTRGSVVSLSAIVSSTLIKAAVAAAPRPFIEHWDILRIDIPPQGVWPARDQRQLL